MSPVIAALNALAAGWGEAMLRAGWQGGVAIMLAWLACRALPRLSPAAQCWLWRFAYLKLVVALFWATPVDVRIPLPPELPPLTGPVGPATEVATPAHTPEAVTTRRSGGGGARLLARHPAARSLARMVGGAPTSRADPSGTPTPRRPARLAPVTGALALWLLGSIACWRRILLGCRAARRLREGCEPLRDAAALDCCVSAAKALGLRRPPCLLEGPETGSPLLLGGREPAVVLPGSVVRERPMPALGLALAHELAHLKRGDLSWGWLRATVHGFFFFHPLLWLAAREWRLSQEMACDAEALRITGAGAGEYGAMLLAVLAPTGRPWGPGLGAPGTVTIGEESARTLKRRLKMLRTSHSRRPVERDPTGGRRRAAALAALVAAAVGLIPWRVTAQERAAPPDRSGPEVATPSAGAPRVMGRAGDGPAPTPDRPPTAAVPGAGAPGTTAPASAEPEPALAEQWEDVLLLEAVRYLRLSTAQLRQILTLARAGSAAFERLGEEEKRTRAAVARIARENRAALLAGRPGTRQDDALELERSLRRRRAMLEQQVVEFVLPRLARILTREQVIRACLLTLGELPRERDRILSAALVDPEAGFVLPRGADPQPGRALANQLRERVGQLQGRWEEHRDARARQLLAGHYPPEVLEQVFTPRFWLTNLPVLGELFQLNDGAPLNYTMIAGAGDGGQEDPLVAAARRDLEALRARNQVSLGQVLTDAASAEDLIAALRPLTSRMFLSARLRPVLEERLGQPAP